VHHQQTKFSGVDYDGEQVIAVASARQRPYFSNSSTHSSSAKNAGMPWVALKRAKARGRPQVLHALMRARRPLCTSH